MMSEFADRGKLEQIRKWNFLLQDLLQIRVHGNEEQGIAAEIEEVVVEAHVLNIQNALPELCERALEFATGNSC